jgi:hypothetical protein
MWQSSNIRERNNKSKFHTKNEEIMSTCLLPCGLGSSVFQYATKEHENYNIQEYNFDF